MGLMNEQLLATPAPKENKENNSCMPLVHAEYQLQDNLRQNQDAYF